jgi:hypothetical protein
MNGAHLAKLMARHGHTQKKVAQTIDVSMRTIQLWTARQSRSKAITRSHALTLLKMYMNLELARLGGITAAAPETLRIDDALVDAILSLEIFESTEVSFKPSGAKGEMQTVPFSKALRGTVTERKLAAESRTMLLQETLTQVERSNLDAASFVHGVSEQNVVLEHVRKYLEARTCRLRLRDAAPSGPVDRAWIKKALDDIDAMEGRLSDLRTGLRGLLEPR